MSGSIVKIKDEFSLNDNIGEIVAEEPRASEIFRKHGIDFCCGGGRSLRAVVESQGLNSQLILKELNAARKEGLELKEARTDWQTAPLTDLIGHIVSKHHQYLQHRLPELAELAVTTLRAHGAQHPELSKVHKLFNALKADLEQHLITEEEIVFPAVTKYEETGEPEYLETAINAIKNLEEEHEGAGKILQELRKVTSDYRIPTDACPTYSKTYEYLSELELDIHQHVHLENNILHRRLKTGTPTGS